MENPIKMDDLGVPLCSETSIYSLHMYQIPSLGKVLHQLHEDIFRLLGEWRKYKLRRNLNIY